MLLFSFLFFSFNSFIVSFKWKVNDSLDPLQVLTLSERYMFSSNNGPILLKQGESFIFIKTEVLLMMNTNTSTSIKYVIYATDFEHNSDYIGLCGESISNYPWASNTLVRTVPTTYEETRRNPLNNALVYFYRAIIHKKYEVKAETWHNVAFQICGGESQLNQASLTGTIEFHNPYGYIPAELYGIFPFEAARVVAFLILTVYYIYLFRAHESSILPLHKAVFVVLFVALAEATVWFAAYQKINITGTPYCCPFPPLVVGALIMQLLRQALSRCLLLVVSLGYGIVRPKLLWVEWISVAVITILYFTIATSYEVSNIVSLDVHPNSSPKTAGMLLPSMFIDLLFLSWIYLALSSTIRILTEFQQTHKLKMYERLYNTIAIFSVLFILISFLMSMKTSGVFKFPWQWEWMQQVSWEVLNFSALAAVCLICSPSDNSRLLSYVSQLPTEDPDDTEEQNGIQLTGPQSYANYSDSDSDDNSKSSTSIHHNNKNIKNNNNNSNNSSLYSNHNNNNNNNNKNNQSKSKPISSLSPIKPPTISPSKSNPNSNNLNSSSIPSMYSLPSADDDEDQYTI